MWKLTFQSVLACSIIAQSPGVLGVPVSDDTDIGRPCIERVGHYCYGATGNASDSSNSTSNSNTNPKNVTFSFPLPDGFPNLSSPSEAFTNLTIEAQGTPPGSLPPSTVSNNTLTSLRLIAFASMWDVAFLSSFSQAISSNYLNDSSDDFTLASTNSQDTIVELLNLSSAQSQIQAYSTNQALNYLKAAPVPPCSIYNFPGISPSRSLSTILKSYFTYEQLRLGTLASIQFNIANAGAKGEAEFVSVIGGLLSSLSLRSGILEAWLNNGTPLGAPTPFLVQGGVSWLYSTLVQQGVCDQLHGELTVFDELKVTVPSDIVQLQVLNFTVSESVGGKLNDLAVVYVNQQNVPLAVNVTNAASNGGQTWTFNADFPYQKYSLDGLTIAVLVDKTAASGLQNAADVEAATVAGPALIM